MLNFVKFNYMLRKIFSICILSVLMLQFSFGQNNHSEKPYVPNQVIVRMQDGHDPYLVEKQMPQHYGVKLDRVLSKRTDIWLFNFDDEETDVPGVLAELKKVQEVFLAQANHEVQMRVAPNDPNYGNQWQHQNIDSELAWDITTGGTTANGDDVVVCVIESADVMGHPDLQNNHWINTNETPNDGVDNDGNGYVDDYNGWNAQSNDDNIGSGNHGTAVAGMIGAQGDNGQGVAGANWNVKIMVVAGHTPLTEANVIAAYDYPLNARTIWNQSNGADGAFVVATNASWGINQADPSSYPIWCSFYDDLGQAGILNCGATANSSYDVDVQGDMPTGCASDYMIGVTATDNTDQVTFAAYGDQTINVAAPGDNIYSTDGGGGYSYTSGTSFASPLTAGVIGLMYSIPCPNFMSLVQSDPQGTADIVKSALMNGVDQSTHLQARTISGGRINAKNSIDLLMNQTCSSCTPPQNLTTNTVNDFDASIAYDDVPDANSYDIFIQEQGSGSWSSYNTANLSYTFNGLTSCTVYEVYIESDCGNETSFASDTLTFTTTGCGTCIELPYCATGTDADPGETFTLHSPSGIAGSYSYDGTNGWGGDPSQLFAYGELVLVDDGTAAGDEGCNALVNGAAINGNIAVAMRGNCTFTSKALNAQNAGARGIVIINNDPNGTIVMGGSDPNVTIPAIMISQADGNTILNEINGGNSPMALLGAQNEWIESMEIDGNLVNSGDNNGYRPPDLAPINLNIGQSVPFTMTPGFNNGQPLQEYTRIWLDLDQNGTFDTGELIYDQGNTSQGVLTDVMNIPGTATAGNTRMRVQMAYQGYAADPLPGACGNFTSGEVEDYCVELSSGTPCNLNVASTVEAPKCSEAQDGSISLNVSGGTPGYTYQWNNGAGNVSSINNLNAGTYNVTITDGSGCDTTISYSLTYSVTNIQVNGNITDPSCPGQNDGSITANATGSTNFSYQWLNGPATAQYNNLDAGTYEVTATDNFGCTATENFTLDYSVNLSMTETLVQPTCNDTQDGEITVSVSGGTNVTYQWNGGPASSTWSGLGNGTYSVTATDASGCQITDSYTLVANPDTPAAGFNVTTNFLDVSFFNLTTNANSYEWDFGDGNTSTDFNPTHTYSEPGTYTVCLTAFGDCEASIVCKEVTVSEDDASLNQESWENAVVVYPNPSSGDVHFSITSTEANNIVIFDATGKEVAQTEVVEKETTISTTQWNNGVYYFHIQNDAGQTLYTDRISIVK